MIEKREQEIIDFLKKNNVCSSKELFENGDTSFSYATLKRMLTKLVSVNYISTTGKGKGTKYRISDVFELIQPIDIDNYFKAPDLSVLGQQV